MMNHETLIARLSAGAAPVRTISPAWMRALVLAPLMLALGYAATALLQRAGRWTLPYAPLGVANAALSLLLGVTCLAQALSMSIAGNPIRGRGRMMAIVALWLAVVAASIDISPVPNVHREGQPFCLAFLLVAGVPMVAVVILALRRTRSLTPIRSLAMAGVGVMFLSFALLAFCHPAELSIADFVTHVMAALILGLLTVAFGRRAIAT